MLTNSVASQLIDHLHYRIVDVSLPPLPSHFPLLTRTHHRYQRSRNSWGAGTATTRAGTAARGATEPWTTFREASRSSGITGRRSLSGRRLRTSEAMNDVLVSALIQYDVEHEERKKEGKV